MQHSSSYPKFAVVGHPNKGKSSIVSTLALDNTVQVGNTPGTTQVKRSFPLRVDNRVVYELFDTPGFQRARRVLAWLQEHEPSSADKRVDVVREFVALHRDDKRFRDEIELLEPIIDGAGIIYVVDASKPYGAEYEIEMEILRWTSQPSMAILNLIGRDDYRDEWSRALGQYFRLVRTFNPLKASFTEHMQLLESMAQLKEDWTYPIKDAISILERLYNQRVEESIDIIVSTMFDILSYVERKRLIGESASPKEIGEIKRRYREKIIKKEKSAERQIEQIWNHKGVEKISNMLDLDSIALFSKESASIFGLKQREVIMTGAGAGAVGGVGIDLALGGSSLFVGSLIGGLIGGVGAIVGFDNLYRVKVLGQKVGKRELTVGPMQNINFPYILLSRVLYYASEISKRSHASREAIELKNLESFASSIFDSKTRDKLEEVHSLLREEKDIPTELRDEYRETVRLIYIRLIED
ncbi:MAG: GTPase/DUF3482 domain-containing protein [Epsilonproteobacteria bacterium]|nr:GTPase/DUF3482 domain-containing protein [Campylobacterota bacterium]